MSTQDALALRRKLAELQGWRDVEAFTYWREDYEGTYEVHSLRGTSPEGNPGVEVPNWPDDSDEGTGAALALCLDIARRHPVSNWEWDVLIGQMSSGFYAVFIGHDRVYHREYGDTPALALSLLALAALEAEREP